MPGSEKVLGSKMCEGCVAGMAVYHERRSRGESTATCGYGRDCERRETEALIKTGLTPEQAKERIMAVAHEEMERWVGVLELLKREHGD